MVARAKGQYVADDIWETPDDGNRYEVLDGAMVVTPPPRWPHQNAASVLHIRVGHHVLQHRLGYVVEAPTGLVLDDHNGLQPDLIYISNERAHIITERGVEGAPDLVVEILSRRTQTRDRTTKMRRYAAAGIPHYWIVVPATRSLEAYRLGEQGYELTGTYGPGSVFRPDLFPGPAIAIDDLWV